MSAALQNEMERLRNLVSELNCAVRNRDIRIRVLTSELDRYDALPSCNNVPTRQHSRQEFEKYAKRMGMELAPIEYADRSFHYYANSDTQNAWELWCIAYQQAKEPSK